jgi:hypothetical protein
MAKPFGALIIILLSWLSARRKAIERVMKAYLSTRKLSVEQAELVRAQLTKFIDDLPAIKDADG